MLSVVARHFRQFNKSLTLEQIDQTTDAKFNIKIAELKQVLGNLCEFGILETKFTIIPGSKSSTLMQWSYRFPNNEYSEKYSERILFNIGKYD